MQEEQTKSAAPLEELKRGLREGIPALDEGAQRVSLALYRRLALGRPVPVDELAQEPGLPAPAAVQSIVDGWPAVYRDDAGSIVGYWGLSLGGASHRIEVDGVNLTAWCAWDTLFLPWIFEREITVRSACPTTGEDVVLRVDPTGVKEARPGAPVLSFLDPSGKVGDDSVISAFCHHVHFFVDRAAGELWIKERDGALLLSLDEGWELAVAANLARFGPNSTASHGS